MSDITERLRLNADDKTKQAMQNDGWNAADEIDRLRAEVAALRADAERYRWLRARKPGGTYRIAGLLYREGDANFDAAIDAARKTP